VEVACREVWQRRVAVQRVVVQRVAEAEYQAEAGVQCRVEA
jgi:hypothetical protein